MVSRRIVLAMSGGVDSSASAVLLKQQGWEVIGLFMRSGAQEAEACATKPGALPVISAKPHKQGCCSASDAADARRVADRLDIPFHALNFADAFTRIKDYFADEYLAGRTPNPCVQCNNWLKFGKLWEFAQQVGAEAIATGHYARIETNPLGRPCLTRGLDLSKDQSYVLFGIRRDLLSRILFPVGNYTKPAIRELAAEAGLRVATKPDSMEICFIPDNDYAGFLQRYREFGGTAGHFVDPAGNILGDHPGFEQFTVGQRRGLGIAFGEPRFVIRIEPETRQVVLGTKQDLEETRLIAHDVNWLTDPPTSSFSCLAQIRSQHTAAAVTASPREDGDWDVLFDEPQLGVAPGQGVVLYDDQQVVGGGWIRRFQATPQLRLAERSAHG
jgi:tRNA-uridine 2-sulfurtransferase